MADRNSGLARQKRKIESERISLYCRVTSDGQTDNKHNVTNYITNGYQASNVRHFDIDQGQRGSRTPAISQNFDRDARPIFLGLKFGQILFCWVGKFFSYFTGFRKISAIFWV